MRYGMPYQGSKSKIVDALLTVIPPAVNFYDLMCGGCAVAHAAMHSGKWNTVYINDINPMLPEAFVKAISGGFNSEDRWVSREDFLRLRDSDPYASICFSFGSNLRDYCYAKELEPYKKAMHYAIFFDDWSLFRKLCSEICDYCQERVGPIADRTARRIAMTNAIRKSASLQANPLYKAKKMYLESLERLQATSSDYRNIQFEPDSVIYCDIPYIGTKGYKARFDHDAFYDWAERQEYQVFVSSYEMPNERFKCIWEYSTYSNANAYRPKMVVERLFVPRSQNYIYEHSLFDMEEQL